MTPTAPTSLPSSPDRNDALTGGSSSYYKITLKDGRTIDLLDIIEALYLNFNEGNIFKAVMRRAMNRLGQGKQGTTAKYDAEKMVFFSERELARETAHGADALPSCTCGGGDRPGSAHRKECAIFAHFFPLG